ncbi:hypothetical protein C0J45_23734, partial [Silurus meridionalis]
TFSVSLFTDVFCATELIQPDSVLLKPGETLSITCRVSGASITDSSYFGTAWIRHPAVKSLEWIGSIRYEWSTFYSDNKFSISRDTSTNTITIRGQNIQAEDTAVYYCTHEPHNETRHQHNCTKTICTGVCSLAKSEFFLFVVYVHGEELTQPASMTVQPGQSLSINCKVSYSVTSSHTAWIRQPAGKALEWIGYISSGGGTAYSDKLKNKFSISRDTSSNTVTLTGQTMQNEDTAVYYCARYTQ